MLGVEITTPWEADLPAISALAWPSPDVARTKQIKLRNWFDRGSLLVARIGDDIVGVAVIENSFFDNGFVRLVKVAEKHRRRHIGEALVTTLMEHTTADKLFTSAQQSNYAARMLLESLGWEFMGTVRGIDEDDPEMFYRAPLIAKAAAVA